MTWDIKDAKRTNISLKGIPIEEQECHFNCQRESGKVVVCCSSQPFLTKLEKNPLFKASELLISCDTGKILQVIGELPGKAISLRKTLSGKARPGNNQRFGGRK